MLLVKNSHIDPNDSEMRLKYSRAMDVKIYLGAFGKYPNPRRVSHSLAPFDELFEFASWRSLLMIEKHINRKK